MISASDLEEKDSTEVLSVLGVNEKEISHQQKLRDLLKGAIIKTTKKAVFVLIGIENQSDIHYAMPVKSMIGFKKKDKLTPVIPITLYLGPEYSKNKERFESYILENFGFKDLDNETVEAINIFAGSNIKINKNGGSLELAIATFNNVSEEMIKDIYAEVTQ